MPRRSDIRTLRRDPVEDGDEILLPAQFVKEYHRSLRCLVLSVAPRACLPADHSHDFEHVAAAVQSIPLLSFLRALAGPLDVAEDGTIFQLCIRITDKLVAETQLALLVRPPRDRVRLPWARLRSMSTVCLAWTFPPHRKEYRATTDFHRLLVTLHTMVGLLYIACYGSAVILKASRAIHPDLQAHLLGEKLAPDAVMPHIRLVREWLARNPCDTSPENGFQYCLLAHAQLYWGYGGERREQSIGLIGRFLEHFSTILLIQRRRIGQQDKRAEAKYLQWKNIPIDTFMFVPQYLGSGTLAYAREQLAIRMCPTKGNRREKRPEHVPPTKPRPLHRWQREKLRTETPTQRAIRLNFHHVVAKAPNTSLDETGWVHLSFDQYYVMRQHMRLITTGEIGPCPLFGPNCGPMLVLWLANHRRRKLDVDWKRTSKEWWLEAATLHKLLPKEGARRSVGHRLLHILRRYNVTAGPTVVKVETCEWVKNADIRKAISQTLALSEAGSTVSYATENLQISRSKIPTVHQQGRQHKIYAKNYDHQLVYG